LIFTGHRVGQIRVIFSIPPKVQAMLFPSNIVPEKHLAYIEWFTKFSERPETHHQMYKICRSMKQGDRVASIIPLSLIRCSIHLFPKFGSIVPRNWSSSNVLELCSTFFVNPYTDRYTFVTAY
jgi:hypothetical protein